MKKTSTNHITNGTGLALHLVLAKVMSRALLKLGKYLEQYNDNLGNSDYKYCLMTRLSVFHVIKVATPTQVKVIYSHPYFLMCISVYQTVRNIDIAVSLAFDI